MTQSFKALTLTLLTWMLCVGSASANANANATQCRDEVLRTSRADERIETFSTPEAEEELSKGDCEQRGVYCVDASGYPVPGEADPDLRSNETLIVKLFGPKSCDGVLTVGTDMEESGTTLFREEPPTPRKEKDTMPPLPAVRLLAKATAKTNASTESVTVVVSRADVRISINGDELYVTPPRYFLDVGLLVAFSPEFQTVSTSRAPGSTEEFIREERTIHPSGAVTVNYFPFGQYAVPRFSDYHGLGIQAGIGGDLTELDDEFYLGLIWEPIPGAGISGGLALLAMERLQPDYSSGALVNPNDVPRDDFMGPRFYFGVCLNAQVFQTVLQLGGKALVPNR